VKIRRVCTHLFAYFALITSTLNIHAQVSKPETNANRMVEICFVDSAVLPAEKSIDFNRDVVLRLSYYQRSDRPRDSREEWQPATRFGEFQVKVVDQYPNSTRALDPVRKIQTDDHEFLITFQKDPGFFTGHEEIVLNLSTDYHFLFHFSTSEFFGDSDSERPCRRESNANNRVDITLLTSEQSTEEEQALFDLERNIGFRVVSYERSYTPRDDREQWRPHEVHISAYLQDQYPIPILREDPVLRMDPGLRLDPVRQLKVNDQEVAFAFQQEDFLASFNSWLLVLDVPVGLLSIPGIPTYVISYETSELGVQSHYLLDRVTGLRDLFGKSLSQLTERLDEPHKLVETDNTAVSALWAFADYSIGVDFTQDRSRVTTVHARSKEAHPTFEKIISELGLDNYEVEYARTDNKAVQLYGADDADYDRLSWFPEDRLLTAEDIPESEVLIRLSGDSKEVLVGDSKITVRWLAQPPAFINEKYRDHVVFDIRLRNVTFSREPNFNVQDHLINPGRVVPATGIIRVRNFGDMSPSEQQFFVLFPRDTDFFEQQNDFVLKIFDGDGQASPNEHYVRIEAPQMDKTYQKSDHDNLNRQ